MINGVEGAKATTTISVNTLTAITKQPAASDVCEGSQATFGISVEGSGNLTYLWTRNGQPLSDSSATTPQLTLRNVTTANNGTYQVKVTGACGTSQSNPATLRVSSRMSASTSTQPALCSGDANGSFSVAVTGGLDNKQYRLSTQSDYQAQNNFSNLRAGVYTVQVRDPAGCTIEAQAEVKQPERITFTVEKPTNAKCAGGNDGGVNVQAMGGNGDFKYSINGGADQPSGQFQNLQANTSYTLKATDVKGCQATTNAFVGAPNQLVVSLTPVSVLCNEGSTGKINVAASGGTGAYTYQLGQNAQQSGNVFGDLKAGTYTVAVKDDNGCAGKADITVNQPTALSIAGTATLVSCVSDTSAQILVSGSGGTGPYQYQAGTRAFQAGATFGGVREGAYPIVAKDANGCTANTSVTVKKAEPLLLQTTTQAASCCTCPDGSIALVGSGGIGQKQFQLGGSGYQTGNSFKSLTAGPYAVVVRDETGCLTSTTVTVTNATAATLTLTNLKNVNCAGGRDGGATVQIAGGKKPYTYAWQSKIPTDSLGNGPSVTRLPEGEFTVTVTDSSRCSSMKSGTLTAQNPLPPKPTVTQSGGNLVSSASSGIQWYSGPDLKTGKPVPNATQATFTPYQSNPYFVVVTQNGCLSPPSDIFTFVLTALEPIQTIALRVVPNPVSDQLRIEIDQPERASVRIRLLDLTGKTILDVQTPVFSGTKQFDWSIQGTKTGLYLLQAESGARGATERVLVH